MSTTWAFAWPTRTDMGALSWSFGARRIAFGMAAVLLLPAMAIAQTQNLNLAWDPNPEPDIESYYVHVGTSSGNYNVAVQQVPASQTTYAFPATPGVKYYFAVKAVNEAGLWSPPSNEIVGGVPTFAQPANQSGTVGVAITPFTVNVVDPDGGTLQFSATNLPPGLTINSGTGRISGTPTTAGTRTVTVFVFDGSVTVQRSFTWTIAPAAATVTAVSASPSSGSGDEQTFTLQYGDTLGAADLATAWVWFNHSTTSSAADSCLIYLNRPANLLYLLDDSGRVWSSASLGMAATLQNGQCAVNLAASQAVASGNTLALTLAMRFEPSYSGAKNIYMFGASAGGSNSGWQDRGDWSIPAPLAAAVTTDSVTPSTGSGASQTFALKYSDTLGASDLATTWVWFNSTLASSAANSCLVYYNRSTNTLFLLNDAGTAWQPAALGSASTLQNGQCALAASGSSVSTSGTTLTLQLAVTFKPGYSGQKNIYTYAASATGAASGWHDRGDWTVPDSGTPAPAVTVDSVSPASGSGTSQLFTLKYSDSLGATRLSTAWLWINSTLSATAVESCLIYYNRATNTVFLLNDAGTQWQPAAMGSGATLQNGQCAIALGGSSAGTSGNTLTLNLSLTFKAAYAGAKNIYMFALNSLGLSSGWQDRGDWSVPAPVTDPASDPIAHWRFDEGSGTAAFDAAGSHDATLMNGASWSTERGSAVVLDGVNDYVSVPSLDVSGSALTITAWVKNTSFLQQRFISKATDTSEQAHYWMLSQYDDGGARRLRFRLKAGGSTTTLIASSGNAPLNTWYHVAATYDGSMMRLYLNGTLVGSVAKSGALATNGSVPVNIGRNPDGSNYLAGALDDVRIYDRALSGTEIAALAAN